MGTLLKNNIGTVVSVLISIATLIYAFGIQKSTVDNHEQSIQKLTIICDNLNKSVTQHTFENNNYGQQINELQIDQRTTTNAVFEIKSDVRVIAEWVRDQKSRDNK